MKNTKTLIIIFAVLVGICLLSGLAIGGFILYSFAQKSPPTTYEECVAQKNPIMDSFPEKCRSKEGKTFTNWKDGEKITVIGDYECLPHKDQSGPQTLECAFGIKTDSGEHFGLDDPELKFVTKIGTNKRFKVEGIFKKSTDSQYNTVGTIEITAMTVE